MSCESGTNDTLGEAGNFLAECFSGDGEGEHGHLAVDPNAATASSGEAGEFVSPRKKAKGAAGLPPRVKTEEANAANGKNQETPLAMKAGAYRLNKLMEVR